MRKHRKRAAAPRRLIAFFWILTVLFIGCAVFGAVSLATSLTSYEFGNSHYEELRDVARVTPRPTTTPTPTPDAGVVPITLVDAPAARTEPAVTPRPTATPKPIDFVSLKKINSDIVGWIRFDDTVIDYPIVQTNNNTRYLSHLFDGSSNQLGTLFMDYENKGGFDDRHILIYGHDMQDGSMFGSLENYMNSAYYKSHTEGRIYLPDGSAYRLVVFAATRMAAFRSELPVSFASDEEFYTYVEKIRRLSAFSTDLTIGEGDCVVSLCTCVPDSNNYRFIVSGKLVKIS